MESAQEALKKIPLALNNLGVDPKLRKILSNYMHNLMLTILKDTEVQRRLHTEPEKLIEELSKV